MKTSYIHSEIPEMSSDFLSEGNVVVRNSREKSLDEVTEIALLTMKLAMKIGIQTPKVKKGGAGIPYSAGTDNIVFPCPLNSALMGKRINFLRGWKQFESCIKGFNALGLIADQVRLELKRLKNLSPAQVADIKRNFLKCRKSGADAVFSAAEIAAVADDDLLKLNLTDLAIWRVTGAKTIVCSTSSNMGISLHDSLRYFQRSTREFLGKKFTILNQDEGKLVIWCPDPEADFMNKEKTGLLQKIEAELPPLTKLRTYINRTQRDPGALRDALECGGYFFPTNPQSTDEIQNLLFVSLSQMAEERKCTFEQLLEDKNVREALRCLKCEISGDQLFVDEGIEGGISGLAVPYFLMLEELLADPTLKSVVTWNQASIGAALAAAVVGDLALRKSSELSETTRSELNSLFPNISRYLDHKRFGKDLETRVHGVFDIANLQSLAQLLGVVVEKHLSGRGTPYVGLGSSSYSNGNRCYEILRNSMEQEASFKGKSTFHPATHTINPFAQALVFIEDVYRAISSTEFSSLKANERAAFVRKHVRKPEPAGAAAYAGYLLARLDRETLSIVEIAYTLKLGGFTKLHFLEFCGLHKDASGMNKFFQESSEEGVYMGELARNILLMLDWPIAELSKKSALEREYSRLKYGLNPLDDLRVESLDPLINIYLTGDNTSQPSEEFVSHVVDNLLQNQKLVDDLIKTREEAIQAGVSGIINFKGRFCISLSEKINALDKKLNASLKNSVRKRIEKRVKQISAKHN